MVRRGARGEAERAFQAPARPQRRLASSRQRPVAARAVPVAAHPAAERAPDALALHRVRHGGGDQPRRGGQRGGPHGAPPLAPRRPVRALLHASLRPADRRRRVQKDGGCIKKLLALGEGWEQPQKDDKVKGEGVKGRG